MSTKKLTQKEYLLRALRTFLQAAIGYFVANLTATLLGSEDLRVSTVLVGVGTSALAAGLAAVMNLRGHVQNSAAVSTTASETEAPITETKADTNTVVDSKSGDVEGSTTNRGGENSDT